MKDLQKWDSNKKQMQGKLRKLQEEEEMLSADLKTTQEDLKVVQDNLKNAQDDLAPDSNLVKTLQREVDDLKVEVVKGFDRSFYQALTLIKVLYPDHDILGFHVDKIVMDAQIVQLTEGGNQRSSSDPEADRQDVEVEGDDRQLNENADQEEKGNSEATLSLFSSNW